MAEKSLEELKRARDSAFCRLFLVGGTRPWLKWVGIAGIVVGVILGFMSVPVAPVLLIIAGIVVMVLYLVSNSKDKKEFESIKSSLSNSSELVKRVEQELEDAGKVIEDQFSFSGYLVTDETEKRIMSMDIYTDTYSTAKFYLTNDELVVACVRALLTEGLSREYVLHIPYEKISNLFYGDIDVTEGKKTEKYHFVILEDNNGKYEFPCYSGSSYEVDKAKKIIRKHQF